MKNQKNKFLTIVALLSFLVFLIILLDVLVFNIMLGLDSSINQNIVFIRGNFLTNLMLFFTTIGNGYIMLVLFAILFIVLFFKKRNCFLLVASMGAGLILQFIIKLLIKRVRPENSLILEGTYSFPSAHALMSTIFFLVLMILLKDDIKNKILRIVFSLICISMFLTIGFSRIYLSVHWFSDVLAGISLGMFIVSFIILFFEKFLRGKVDVNKTFK